MFSAVQYENLTINCLITGIKMSKFAVIANVLVSRAKNQVKFLQSFKNIEREK